MYKDGHHIVNNRLEWSLRPEAKQLRETPSLIPRLERPLHEQIHRDTPAVPLLGYHTLRRTLNTFEPTNDTLETMSNLMLSIEDASLHTKAHYVERELAMLAVYAIDLQRPYIKEGLTNTQRSIII